jgi:thioredoxin-related protein
MKYILLIILILSLFLTGCSINQSEIDFCRKSCKDVNMSFVYAEAQSEFNTCRCTFNYQKIENELSVKYNYRQWND